MRILKSRRSMLLLVMLLLVALLGAAGVVSAAPTVTNVTAQLNPDYKIVVDGVNPVSYTHLIQSQHYAIVV